MESLRQLAIRSEDDLVRRVIASARAHGYAHHLPALEDSYRETVALLSANLVQSINVSGDTPALNADDDLATDPVVALGARMVRTRAVDVTDARLFVGMLKCYRAAYLDLVSESTVPVEQMWRHLRAVGRFFDRVEIGVLGEMAVNPADVVKAETLDRLAELGGQRDRYVAAFADLPVPVLLLDARGLVENMNAAAGLLFRPLERAHARSHADPSRRGPSPVLADEIEAFRDGSEREASFDRELTTGKGKRYFQVRFTKTYDADEKLSGMLVILNDLTYRRHAEDALRRGQAKYQALFDHMTAGLAYTRVVLDSRNRPRDFTVLEANHSFERLTGVASEGMLGRSISEALPTAESGGPDWLGVLGRVAITGEPAVFEAAVGADGAWSAVSVYSPAPSHVSVMLADITELKRSQESMARSRDFYLELFEGSPSPIWRAGSTGRVDYVNSAWLEFTGRRPNTAIGEGWLEDVHPADRERRRLALEMSLDDRAPFEVEYRLRHRSGEYRWMLEAGRPFSELDGTFGGVIGSTVDISDRKRQEEALQNLSTHDALTGLPIRRLFDDAVSRAVAHARRGHLASVLFLDVDGLRAVNDSAGHLQGDAILRDVADILLATLRSEDLVCRSGGDEFAVLMHDTPVEGGLRAAERVHGALARAHLTSGDRVIGVSIAVVELDGRFDAHAAFLRADSALRRAKADGGGRIVVFDAELPQLNGADTLIGSMATRVEGALRGEGGFVLHFQPVFRVLDGQLAYSESLVRLADGDEVVSAGRFVGVAERQGHMTDVTRWVLQRAARVLAANPRSRLSVNLSNADVKDATLVASAVSILESAGVRPERLVFEIAESAVMPDLAEACAWVGAARAAGFGFALDRFGAGYASARCLRELPVDQVKIDGAVVRSVVSDPRQLALLETVQCVASARGITTVGTCVENSYILRALRDSGIECAQGYHLGMPLPYLVEGPNAPWESLFPGGGAGT